MRQVITIEANGAMSGLQRKPGQGLNLQKFGHAQTTRASEIVWDEDAQAWKIDVLQDAGKGLVTGAKLQGVFDITGSQVGAMLDEIAPSWRIGLDICFGSYDDAVKVEIAYLDALRLKGIY